MFVAAAAAELFTAGETPQGSANSFNAMQTQPMVHESNEFMSCPHKGFFKRRTAERKSQKQRDLNLIISQQYDCYIIRVLVLVSVGNNDYNFTHFVKIYFIFYIYFSFTKANK